MNRISSPIRCFLSESVRAIRRRPGAGAGILARVALPLLLLAMSSGCNGEVPTLDYVPSGVTGQVGEPITELKPQSLRLLGAIIHGYSITPPLPAGLSIHPTTGIISGTPTVKSGRTEYTVHLEADTDSGDPIPDATVRITIEEPAPTSLSYTYSQAVFRVGQAIAPDLATINASVTQWGVSPALPADLNLDPTNGTISGTPTAAAPQTSYVVTATTQAGQVTATLQFEVRVATTAPATSRFVWSGGGDGVLASELVSTTLNPKAYRSTGPEGDVISIAGTPDGRFVYVSKAGSTLPRLILYEIDPVTGIPDQGTDLTTGLSNVEGRLAVDATGSHLLLLNSERLRVWNLDPTTGRLSSVAAEILHSGFITHMAVHPSENLVYVLNGLSADLIAYRLNDLQFLGSTGATNAIDLKVSEAGFVYVARVDRKILQVAAATETMIAGGADALVPLSPDLFDVGQIISGIAVGGGKVFATIPGPGFPAGGSVQRLEVAAGGTLSAGPLLQLDGEPIAIVATDQGTLHVADGSFALVWNIDPATMQLASTTRARNLTTSGRLVLAVVPGMPVTSRSTEWVFTTDRATNKVSAFSHQAGTPLTATSQGTVLTSDDPIEVTIDAQRKHVYVTCASGVIDTFGFDPGTGTLSFVSSATVGATASLFVLSRDGRFAYAFDDKDFYYFSIDPTTGALSAAIFVVKLNDTPLSVAIDAQNTALYIGTAVGIDVAGFFQGTPPALGVTGGTTTTHPVNGIVLNPSGTVLYAADSSGGKLWVYKLPALNAFEPDAATATSHPAGTGTERLAFDPVGMRLFATAPGSDELHAFEVDLLDGGLTNLLIPFNLAGEPKSVVAEGSGTRVFVGLVGAIATHALPGGAELDLLPLPGEALGLAADTVAK